MIETFRTGMAHARWSTIVLYSGFTATGIGCALPGALLPAMLSAWHLQDRGAGWLFFVITAGSASGSLLLSRQLRTSLTIGLTLLAMAAWAWSHLAGWVTLAGLLWGLGLGMTMTSISLMRQRPDGERVAENVRLNLFWAVGAVICPLLLTHALRTSSPRGVLGDFAVGFGLLAVAVAGLRPRSLDERAARRGALLDARHARFGLAGVPLLLIVATMLSTGVEAASGAWLATYAQRSRHGLAVIVAAPTCLWAGLLLSRLLGSLPGAEQRLRRSFKGLLVVVAGAAVGLLIPNGAVLLISSFLIGFGLGPLYPSLLTRVLGYRQTGSIFFLCGVTSAVMPWLTGVLSEHFLSLRAGLMVLVLGAAVLLVVGARLPAGESVEEMRRRALAVA
jgi:FHS family glucose/mannose:H+ symporter-like MFS transporter